MAAKNQCVNLNSSTSSSFIASIEMQKLLNTPYVSPCFVCYKVFSRLCLVEPAICSGFIEEKCLMSAIVAAKTTRVIHADNLRSFIKLSPNIDFVHAVSNFIT